MGTKRTNVRQKSEAGIVLPMALILLMVISLIAVMAAKRSASGEQVVTSLRANTLANQVAETALRYCEDKVRLNDGTLKIQDSAILGYVDSDGLPNQWRTRGNWASGSALVNVLPADVAANASMPTPSTQPRCIIEKYRLPRLDKDVTLSDPYLVTAVGYTPDYRSDANGKVLAGGEVWLQAIIRP